MIVEGGLALMNESKTTAICLQMCPSLTAYNEQQVVACWEWSRVDPPFTGSWCKLRHPTVEGSDNGRCKCAALSLVQVAPSGFDE